MIWPAPSCFHIRVLPLLPCSASFFHPYLPFLCYRNLSPHPGTDSHLHYCLLYKVISIHLSPGNGYSEFKGLTEHGLDESPPRLRHWVLGTGQGQRGGKILEARSQHISWWPYQIAIPVSTIDYNKFHEGSDRIWLVHCCTTRWAWYKVTWCLVQKNSGFFQCINKWIKEFVLWLGSKETD